MPVCFFHALRPHVSRQDALRVIGVAKATNGGCWKNVALLAHLQ